MSKQNNCKCSGIQSCKCHKTIVNKPVEVKVGGAGKDGLDAYNIAVLEGFRGTVQEWLDSINGETPYIGDNGNWWIGGVDTGVKAKGEKGDPFTYDDFTPEELNDIKNSISANVESLKPIASGMLPTPDSGQIRRMGVVGEGVWAHPTLSGGSASLTSSEQGTFFFDGESWELVNVQELPEVKGVDVIDPKGEGVTKEKAVATYVSPLMSVVIPSKNLYNPEETLQGGYRLTDGTVASSDNLIRTPLKSITTGHTTMSVTGAGGIAGAQARIVFYNNLTPLSQTQDSIEVLIPVGATHYGVTIANEANIGLDPVNNPYRNTLMINYGAPAQYEPYDNTLVDADKLNKVPTLVQNELNSIDHRVSFLEGLEDYEYEFPVGESIKGLNFTLNNTGDYVEFTGRANTPTVINVLRMFGDEVSNKNSFGFYGNMLRLRENISSGAWVEFTGVPTFEEHRKYKLQVNEGSWELYIDDILFGTKPKTAEFIITNIGNGYAQTLPFWLKDDVNISVGGVVSTIKNFDILNHNIIKTVIPNGSKPIKQGYSDVYISLDKTGYSGRNLITVYVKRESGGNYVGFLIGHQVTSATDANLYRIIRAHEYSFDGETMTQIGSAETISTGESEFTTQVQGRSGHFGGAHGREEFEIIKMFIDGKEMSMTTSFPLTPAKTFFYIQKSVITDDDEAKTPLMEHYKRTDFSFGKYKTFNRVVGLVSPSINMQYIYTGIVCIGRSNATKVTDDYFNSADLGKIDGTVLNNTGKSTLNFQGVSLGIEVTSKSIAPQELNNITPKMWVQDRLTIGDSKYYKVNNGEGTRVLAENEIWEVECEVKFK